MLEFPQVSKENLTFYNESLCVCFAICNIYLICISICIRESCMVFICMYPCSKHDTCIYVFVLAYVMLVCFVHYMLIVFYILSFQLLILLVKEDRDKCYRSGTQ